VNLGVGGALLLQMAKAPASIAVHLHHVLLLKSLLCSFQPTEDLFSFSLVEIRPCVVARVRPSSFLGCEQLSCVEGAGMLFGS
jgi:hypothetical protein